MIAIRQSVCLYLVALVFQLVQSASAADDVGELLDALISRIETLEASDAANKAKIAEMETEFKLRQSESEREISVLKETIKKMESDFKYKEETLLKRVYEQGTTTNNDRSGYATESKLAENNNTDHTLIREDGIQERRSRIRKIRDVPEMETAFYATHAVYSNHDLGANQVIPFQQTITNNGNAYNSHTSLFVAPVDGTYVFHATLLGLDMPIGHSKMRAHFDVDGTQYSVLYVSAYDQTSQMLVINLKAGQSVSLRNDNIDAGFRGQHYSSFSGFLLYQHSSITNIVGK
ncbi:hypothetical protein ACF0H5_010867 [Mactra antiquata]